jgi:(E)-4-hydroxy-3-methylbut-2-enyl-diphosphate synthase
VTEAGDGEDGRIKSAVGTGALLDDGIGDTVRAFLTSSCRVASPVDLLDMMRVGHR